MSGNYGYGKIVTDGLILAYDAADTNSYPGSGTTWNNLTSKTNNATLINGPTFSSSGSASSIELDGSDDYISCGAIDIRGGFTCEIWTKFKSVSVLYGLFGQGPTVPNQGLHILYHNGSRGMIFGMYYNDADYGNNFRPVVGVWYHFAFTYDGTNYTKKFYVNGEEISPTSLTQNNYTGTGQFNIGTTYSSAIHDANGYISSTRVYSRDLSAQEVLQNYNAQKTRFN